jgi:hypothetical protein
LIQLKNCSFLFACALIALTVHISCTGAACAAGKKVKAWKFEQRNQLGAATFLVSENAIKVQYHSQGVQWNCSAPDWQVVASNPKLNLGKVLSLHDYSVAKASRFEFGRIDGGPTSSDTVLFMGKPANKMVYHVTAADPIKEKIEMMYQTASKRATAFSDVELVFSNWFKLKPEICRFLTGLYSFRGVRGILMNETYFYPDGKKHVVLSTDRFSEVMVDPSEFKAPSGFKFAYMHQIMQEDKKAMQMSGVLEDLFLDAPAKKTGAPSRNNGGPGKTNSGGVGNKNYGEPRGNKLKQAKPD